MVRDTGNNIKLILFLSFLIPIQVYANIMCNDGTISSSCGDCHQGCCSRHGGCQDNYSDDDIYGIELYDSENYSNGDEILENEYEENKNEKRTDYESIFFIGIIIFVIVLVFK